MANVKNISTQAPETPSQQIVNAASQTTDLKDSTGRVITIKMLKPLDRLRMFEVIGAENSKNEQYVGYASLAFLVAAIDGEPVAKPSTKIQLEALMQRLDDPGLEAIAMHLAQQIERQQTAAAAIETLKNA